MPTKTEVSSTGEEKKKWSVRSNIIGGLGAKPNNQCIDEDVIISLPVKLSFDLSSSLSYSICLAHYQETGSVSYNILLQK